MSKRKNHALDVVSIRLVKDAPLLSEHPINSPDDAVKLLGQYLCEMDREVFCIINLKTNQVPINCSIISVGSLNESLAHPREILKTSILSNADKIIMLHNHPSGTLTPSSFDTKMTDRMMQLCDMIGIPLIDHIIVGGDNNQYFSFKAKDILQHSQIHLEDNYKNLNFDTTRVAESGRGR